MIPLDPLYTPRQAAPLLGSTPDAVRDMIHTGELAPVIDRGPSTAGQSRGYLIPESTIRAWRNQRTVRTA